MSEFNKFADLMIEAAYQENIKNLGKPMAELMKQSVIQLKPVIEIFFNKGMEIGKAQAVPAQLDVNSILHDIDCYFDNGLSNTERTANNLLQSIYEKLSGEVKAQEPAND